MTITLTLTMGDKCEYLPFEVANMIREAVEEKLANLEPLDLQEYSISE